MPQILRLDIASLSPSQRKKFEQLTDPIHHPLLQSPSPSTIAIGAILDEDPIGLALSTTIHLKTADLLSLYVIEQYRNKKIGTQLLSLLEQELKQQNYLQIITAYPGEDETTPYFQNILVKAGWSPPVIHLLQCYFNAFDLKQLIHAPHLTNDFSTFPWKELTAEEESELRHQEAQWVFPTTISPFNDEYPIDSMSLGLRHQGKVVGWVILQRFDPDTIRYTALYIQNAYKLRGYAIRLLADAVQTHINSKIPWGLFEVNPSQVESNWMRFVYRKLVPMAHTVKHILKSSHIYTSNSR